MIHLLFLMKCSTNYAAFYFKLFMCNSLEVLQGSAVLPCGCSLCLGVLRSAGAGHLLIMIH